ncbi:hypothetical protein [Chryseobacterium profundimaris]|uniref:Uncharacterized protein n=1 Tax=Chryseobacterium profundimaris TaxID=1387275 RepID=A0ABY1P5I1_9FLAO|nr:hypothetical protein [Chryseobacterium profundimaris]SMP26759.1 hypothetical protein SAMN06264346_10955 [Chryseobacterium profundimaris]
MITRIEEVGDLQDLGIDLIRFHVYLQGTDGNEVTKPLIIYMWDLKKYMSVHEPQAFAYLVKVSESIRHYGAKDGKVLKVLHEDGFPVHSFVEKYVKNIPADKILSHIKWSQSVEEPYIANAIERADLLPHPEFASNNFRRTMFAETIDEAVQRAVRKFYPDFFENADAPAISKYDDLLMQSVNKLIHQLDDFFFRESEAKK